MTGPAVAGAAAWCWGAASSGAAATNASARGGRFGAGGDGLTHGGRAIASGRRRGSAHGAPTRWGRARWGRARWGRAHRARARGRRSLARPCPREGVVEGAAVGIGQPLRELLAGAERDRPQDAGREADRDGSELAILALRRLLVEVVRELPLERPAHPFAIRAELLQRLLDLLGEHRLREVGV